MLSLRRTLLRNATHFIRRQRFSQNTGIINSRLAEIHMPKITISDYVLQNFSEWEDRVASECALTGRKYTYKEIRSKSRNLSRAFRKKFKLNRGDVVAVLLPNVPEFPLVALAALQAGLVLTTVNPTYTPDEICKQLKDASVRILITLADLDVLAKKSVQLTRTDIPILSIKTKECQSAPAGSINLTEMTEHEIDCHDDNDVDAHALAVLPYSSGTTGLPKGVKLSHFNIVSNLMQLEHPEIAVNIRTTDSHQDITPAVLPMFHIYGFTLTCMLQLAMGCKIVTLPKFSPEIYIGTLRRYKPHLLYLAPPIAIFLANHPSVKREDLSSVRTVVSGAAPLGALDETKLIQKAQKDIPILQGYGLTETSPAVTSGRVTFKEASGSIGLPVPNTELKLVAVDDENGKPLGPNQTGEIYVKGPQVMQGYHNRPEETANIFSGEWLKTGDIAYYTSEGYVFITDRLKELIKVKGFQVAPAELEEVIRDFPNVAEAAVIGIPHPKDGEVPRAYVVPKAGIKIDANKLNAFVSQKVANYKQLRGGISVVDNIPKSATGKILRRVLKSQYENEKK